MRRVKIENMPELPYAVEEALNRLRINTNFLGNEIKKIMVVSSEPNEGKSFVAMHLWRQLAMTGRGSAQLCHDRKLQALRAR
jgi:Mrp family chromosome partitioning ATPase